MVPATLDTLEDIQQFVWRHRRDRTLGDAVEQFEKPSRLFDGRRRSPFPLHLLDIFLGDEAEGGSRGQFGGNTPLALLLYRVDAINELSASLIALLARLLKRQLWEAAKRQLPLVAQHFVAKSPKQRPGGLNDKEEPVGVGNLKWARCGFERANLNSRKHGGPQLLRCSWSADSWSTFGGPR